MIKILMVGFVFLFGLTAQALVNSPTSVEVAFSYQTEFETAAPETAADLVISHAKFLFGYLQNESLVRAFELTKGTEGVGAPLWAPKMTVLSENFEGDKRIIS